MGEVGEVDIQAGKDEKDPGFDVF